MRTIDEILSDYRSTWNCVQEEERQRVEITKSPEYIELQSSIESAQTAQKMMVSTIPDSREEFQMDKDELIRYMEDKQIDTAGEFSAKTRMKRTVDTRQVLEAMQGDIDNLMLVASVKIKDLQDFAVANPEYKRDLRKCIVEEGFTVSDIVPTSTK